MTETSQYFQEYLQVATAGRGMTEITRHLKTVVNSSGVSHGLCHVFIHHTSASLIICENADPDVQVDLETFMSKLVVDGDSMFVHSAEGADDMPAHVRSVLTQTELTIPITNNALALGTWQGIYLWEHRYQGYERKLTVTVHGLSK